MIGAEVGMQELVEILGDVDTAAEHIRAYMGSTLYHIDPKTGLTNNQLPLSEKEQLLRDIESESKHNNLSNENILAKQLNDSHELIERLAKDRESRGRSVSTYDGPTTDAGTATLSVVQTAAEITSNYADLSELLELQKAIDRGDPVSEPVYDVVRPMYDSVEDKLEEDRERDKSKKGKGK